MPRFTIKDLLLATTLIAIGAGMLALVLRGNAWLWPRGGLAVITVFSLWLGGGGCIGAGLLTPFKHPWIGAALGLLIQGLLLFLSSQPY